MDVAKPSPLVGVLGGGQLGRMLALAGYPLDVRCKFVDPEPDAPAGQVAEQIVASFDDVEALEELARSDVVTFEFESVPEAAARRIARHVAVRPSPDVLATAQDRLAEKTLFRELGIPVAPFCAVNTDGDVDRAVAEVGLPALLKTRRLGYDGKGQRIVRERADVASAFAELGRVPSILEGWVAFEREVSQLAVRGLDGRTEYYPLVENHHEDGLLRLSLCPAPRSSAALGRTARDYAQRILERFDYVGVIALEMFELRGGLFANEIAPRVHNSGHFTIEGAATSQFENHLRAILGLPLGSTLLRGHSSMINLIGSVPERSALLALADVHLHAYGKAPRAGRKVGHVTVCTPDPVTLNERTRAVCDAIGWKAPDGVLAVERQ